MQQQQIKALIKKQGVLPLFYHDNAQICLSVTTALYTAGIRCIEFTNRGENAFDHFQYLLEQKASLFPEMIVGIGTIKSAEEANLFMDAGADFLVSPYFDQSVCDTAKANNILWMPGCTTPTEIHMALLAGCSFIKLFPGNILQPSFMEAIKPLFNGVEFMVTGGVDTTEESISAWFKSGVLCVGMGSKLITKNVLDNQLFEELTIQTKKVLNIVQLVR